MALVKSILFLLKNCCVFWVKNLTKRSIEEQDCRLSVRSSWSLLRSARLRLHSAWWWLARASSRHWSEQKTIAEQVGQCRGEIVLIIHWAQLVELLSSVNTLNTPVSTARISPAEIFSSARRCLPFSGVDTTLTSHNQKLHHGENHSPDFIGECRIQRIGIVQPTFWIYRLMKVLLKMFGSLSRDNYCLLLSSVWLRHFSRLVPDDSLGHFPLSPLQQRRLVPGPFQTPLRHLPLAQAWEDGGLPSVQLVHWTLRVTGLQRPPDV